METRFTPGPWVVETNANDIPCIIDGPEHRVAAAYFNGRDDDLPPDQATAEANARLIAAAPDFMSAVGGDLDRAEASACGPLSWLRSAWDELQTRGPAPDCDDPDAFWEMVRAVDTLHYALSLALDKASPSNDTPQADAAQRTERAEK